MDLLIFNNPRQQNIVVRYLSRHGINDTRRQRRRGQKFRILLVGLARFECTRRKREKEREELISLAANEERGTTSTRIFRVKGNELRRRNSWNSRSFNKRKDLRCLLNRSAYRKVAPRSSRAGYRRVSICWHVKRRFFISTVHETFSFIARFPIPLVAQTAVIKQIVRRRCFHVVRSRSQQRALRRVFRHFPLRSRERFRKDSSRRCPGDRQRICHVTLQKSRDHETRCTFTLRERFFTDG